MVDSGVRAAQCTRVYRPTYREATWQRCGRIPAAMRQRRNRRRLAASTTRAFVDCSDVANDKTLAM